MCVEVFIWLFDGSLLCKVVLSVYSSFFNVFAEEVGAGCFALAVFLLSCGCLSSVYLTYLL